MSHNDSKDYYGVLELHKGATDIEIKKSYRKMAMKYHPDKNLGASIEAECKFQEVGEAYDVLSDKEKRATFDQYGYEGVRDGVDYRNGGYQYKENAQEIFENFFGTSNPFATFGFDDTTPFANKLSRPGPKKQEPFMQDLICSLSELYNGCVKTFEISRKRFDSAGDVTDDCKILTINVKQGWKKGTKVTFPGEGDEGVDVVAADIIFVIQEKNEKSFVRDGNNLIYTHRISLSDALSDCSLQIPTLDDRIISVACPEVVSPFYEKLIPGEGMPLSKKPTTRGDLIIKFHILFPKYLDGTKKMKIKELLFNEPLQT